MWCWGRQEGFLLWSKRFRLSDIDSKSVFLYFRIAVFDATRDASIRARNSNSVVDLDGAVELAITLKIDSVAAIMVFDSALLVYFCSDFSRDSFICTHSNSVVVVLFEPQPFDFGAWRTLLWSFCLDFSGVVLRKSNSILLYSRICVLFEPQPLDFGGVVGNRGIDTIPFISGVFGTVVSILDS